MAHPETGQMDTPKGHPKGLYLLFGVEMWERFSYYGMRALLVLYMTKYFLFSTEKAGTIYGWYTGLVYLTPLLGGYIADRYLGARKCILIGGSLMALGHFAMAVTVGFKISIFQDAIVTVTPMFFFYSALILLIFGNGFFKPNISTTVGKLYKENDPRRDGGFTIFYMGINLGAFFSPLVCGTLGEKVGWHWGFGMAGVGMVAGLIMYLWGQKRYLGDAGLYPENKPDKNVKKEPLTKVEKQRIAVIFILAFFVIFFWASFEQAGSSLTLFAEHSTDRGGFEWARSLWPSSPDATCSQANNWCGGGDIDKNTFLDTEEKSCSEANGWCGGADGDKSGIRDLDFPTSWFQSVNPMIIFILAPFFSIMWIKLAKSNRDPSTPMKFVWGLGLLAIGFVVMVVAGGIVDKSAGKVGVFWLLGAYFMFTVGELCLSPVGLSMVTKLSPVRFGSLMMGTWFGANFLSNLVGGLFAGNYDAMTKSTFFMIPVATAGGAALILLVLTPLLKKWMHGIH